MKFGWHLTKLPCVRTLTNGSGVGFSRVEVFTPTDLSELVADLGRRTREDLDLRYHQSERGKFYRVDAGATERDSRSHKAWRPKSKKKVLTVQREVRSRRFEERFGLGKKAK